MPLPIKTAKDSVMKEENIYAEALSIARHMMRIFRREPLGEEEAFETWISENKTAIDFLQEIEDPEYLSALVGRFDQPDRENEVRKLINRIDRYKRKRLILRLTVPGIAASLLLASILIVKQPAERPDRTTIVQSGNHPILSLPDGKVINPDTLLSEYLLLGDGTGIRRSAEKQLTYITTPVGGTADEKEQYNILQIPCQCNYSVILSDGSVVYLNASSILRYPSRFSDRERKVYLEGEAYFEVRKDSLPFIVLANEAQIRVYGTSFNVNTYVPGQVTTVLKEGVVGVAFSRTGQTCHERVLYPNQSSCLDLTTGKQQISEVHVEKYISWIHGYLQYDQDGIEKLIQDLTRWYGIDFEYADEELKSIRISASINKDLPLENVLIMISHTTKVTFLKTERGYRIIKK